MNKKKNRNESGLFLVEGRQAVRELFMHSPHLAREVYVDASGQGHIDIERLIDDSGTSINYATKRVMQAISDTVTPQGIVAVAQHFSSTELIETLTGVKLVAIMHEVRDPGNAGAVIRAADAAGADAVILTGSSIDIYNPKVVRSTTGSLFHLPVLSGVSLEDAVAASKKAGLNVFAADISGTDLDPKDPILKEKTAWLFGNEARGLSSEELQLSDTVKKLPIFGLAESLNLATAASVCLYTSAFASRA